MLRESKTPMNPTVAVVFDSYPQDARAKLLFLRQLIFETAAPIEEVGEIEEALKWGEPSYLTPVSKSGSTIRLAWKEAQEEQCAMYFKCTADLVPAFKERFAGTFKFGGNRSIVFDLNDEVPVGELKQCIALALTYHRNKNLPATDRWRMVESWVT
ncbi:MAG: DUF1801 domain-containing protein [Rubrobacteraceae bacterium]